MNIEELIAAAPEMTEEKLLENIESNMPLFNIKEWCRGKYSSAKEVLDEWDLIQMKKSKLSRSQRDFISGLVGMSLVNMVKDGGESES